MFNEFKNAVFGQPALNSNQLNVLAARYGVNNPNQPKKQVMAKKTQMAQKMPSFMNNLRTNIQNNLTSPGRDSQYLQ